MRRNLSLLNHSLPRSARRSRLAALNPVCLALAGLASIATPAVAQQNQNPRQQPGSTYAAQLQARQQAGQQQAGRPQQPASKQPASQQPAARQPANQFQQAQVQVGQAQAGQAQAGQAQAGQARPQSVPMQLNPEQAAQVNAAQQASIAAGAVNPIAPFPALDAQWQQYLDQVLAKWELESGKVTRYECKFLRYQYDPTLANEDAYTVASGVLKYMKPDKGMFKVEQLVYFDGRDKENKPKYKPNPQKQFGEFWVCDGQYIDVRDENEKKCTKYQLPPQMQGNAIHLSPLPFVFGVKADELKARYWIRPLNPPEGRKNEVWLEVYPRRADDAGNYQRLQVVIDLQDWMPKGLIVFLPNWRADAQHRELYEFKDREINAARLLNALFQQEFIPKDPPKDWKVIIEPYQDPDAQANEGQPKVATQPNPGLIR